MTNLVGGISSGARGVPDIDGGAFRAERSLGPYVWGADGRRYIDTALGFGATVLGHANPAVLSAVREAMERGPMPAFRHDLEEQAAAALAAHTGALSKVIFLNTGSEAVHLACKAARASTGRRTIAKFGAGYDGWFDEVAFGNVQSPEAAMTANERPTKNGITLLRYNDRADAELMFRENGDIAALLIEPVMANAGCVLPEPGYLDYITALARANGALVIVDEVLMGFRLHAGLSCDLLGLAPDFATVGKAIGSGFVVAALLGTSEAMQVFEDQRVPRQGTYNGNPVACAAICATMTELSSLDYARLAQRGDALREATVGALLQRGIEACSSGFGQVFTIWKGSEPPKSYAEAVARHCPDFTLAMHRGLREEGVISMAVNFGRHYLSAAHDDAVMAELQDRFTRMAERCSVD